MNDTRIKKKKIIVKKYKEISDNFENKTRIFVEVEDQV